MQSIWKRIGPGCYISARTSETLCAQRSAALSPRSYDRLAGPPCAYLPDVQGWLLDLTANSELAVRSHRSQQNRKWNQRAWNRGEGSVLRVWDHSCPKSWSAYPGLFSDLAVKTCVRVMRKRRECPISYHPPAWLTDTSSPPMGLPRNPGLISVGLELYCSAALLDKYRQHWGYFDATGCCTHKIGWTDQLRGAQYLRRGLRGRFWNNVTCLAHRGCGEGLMTR